MKALLKHAGGKYVSVRRNLGAKRREKMNIKLFNPSEEDVTLNKNTHSALVHPMKVKQTE